jgi:hypothetical protein
MVTAMVFPSTLSEIEALFGKQIAANAKVEIDGASLGVPQLDALLERTLGGALSIANVTLDLNPSQLNVTGVTLFVDTLFHVSVVFTQSDGKLQVSVDAMQLDGTQLGLNRLATRLVPSAGSLPAEITGLSIANLHFSLDSGQSTFLFSGATDWPIQLGTRNPTVDATVLITQDGADLSGDLAISTATFSVSLALAKGSTLVRGSWHDPAHPLGWDAVVSALGLATSLDLPANVPSLGFQTAMLELDFSDRMFTVSGHGAEGEAFFQAREDNGTWGFTFGGAVTDGWRFSRISQGLSFFDFLSFGNAYLIITSLKQDQLAFPGFTPMSDKPIDVVPGLNFGAEADFAAASGSLAKAVYNIAGTDKATISGQIGTSLVDTKLSASLGGSLLIPPTDNLRLANPALVLLAEPQTVEVEGTLEIQLKDQTIDVVGRLAVSSDEASFTVDVESQGQSLTAPFGFKGVRLEEIGVSLGLQFTPPGVALALEGVFRIGDTPSDKCAVKFEVVDAGEAVAVNPILFYGHFSSLSFPTVFGAVAPQLKLPVLLLSVGLKNVLLFYAEQPTTLPDNTSVLPGFAIQGELDAYSFVMQAALKIDFDSGISGDAAMTPIHLGQDVLSITGHGSLGGAEVRFNTLATPYLDLTFDAQLLDVASTQVNGTITDSGFSFALGLEVPGVLSETLRCNL